MSVTVVKFGGSSLASAEQFKKVGTIIREDPSRRYVVPSAPGKPPTSTIPKRNARQRKRCSLSTEPNRSSIR